MNKQEILENIKNEEDKLLAAKVLDKIKICKSKNKISFTDFLDMHQEKICNKVLNQIKDIKYVFYGGFEESERKVLFFFPEKMDSLINNKFEFFDLIKAIKIKLPNENKEKYSYRIYLSGLMKLGIKREKFGDILVHDDGAYIIIQKDIAEYICESLKTLTRFRKSVIEIIDIKDIRIPNKKVEKYNIIIPSLRLDSIVSELARTSRSIANKIIEEQRVAVNYEEEIRKSREIKENDIITIRGKGKFKIIEVLGNTKKGKIHVLVQHFI